MSRRDPAPAPVISVVIPTYQRRDVVLATLAGLARQERAADFEVVVVVDGSTDGTTEALMAIDPPFAFTVLAQENRGAAQARNVGVGAARGSIVLFLDDDMEPERDLIAEHLKSHVEGAEVVVGRIAPHPLSLDTLLADAVTHWYEQMAEDLAGRAGDIGYADILTGHVSIRRDVLDELGGFDVHFTAGGAYGNEDVDLAYRLVRSGRRIVFNARAVTRQRYVVDARTHLRQYRQAGRADVSLARKHPDLNPDLFERKVAGSPIHRVVWRPVLRLPRVADLAARMLTPWVTRLVDRGRRGRYLWWLYMGVREVGYWRGVSEAGGIPGRDGSVRVLCYHAIADLAHDPFLRHYGVAPEQFAEHLAGLRRAGYHFIGPEEFIRYLDGGPLPNRAVLLTFDDCYRDLADEVAPRLTELGIGALAFAVTGRLGGSNTWDEERGAARLELLDADELRELTRHGIEIGSHGRTHRPLSTIAAAEATEEIAGSIDDLAAAGLPRPRFFAYPHGDCNQHVMDEAAAVGLTAAFTVDAGLVTRQSDRLALPRISLYRSDRGLRFACKVRFAGRYGRPASALARLVRSVATRTGSWLRRLRR